jgi:hypothetical protein
MMLLSWYVSKAGPRTSSRNSIVEVAVHMIRM